jgi:hypothetical protein
MDMGDYLDGAIFLVLGPILLIVVAPIIVGTILMVVSRGKRRQPFPSCGSCGYDLTGSLGETATCPECGSSLEAVGILPAANEQASSGFVIGACLVGVGLAVGAWWTLAIITH